MIINITNEQSGIGVTFTQSQQWVANYGYKYYNTDTARYDEIVNKNLDWAFHGASGLKENLSVSPYTSKGSGQIGSTFVNNDIGERFFTLLFRPTQMKERGSSFGAHTVLAHLVRIKDATFTVTIEYMGTIYTGEYYFSSETSIESGTITMVSTNDVAWSVGQAKVTMVYGEGDNPYITKDLPQTLLQFDSTLGKKRLSTISFEATDPTYKVDYPLRTGEFGDSRRIDDFRITNRSNGLTCTVTDINGINHVTINTKNLTIEAGTGADLLEHLGEDLWVPMIAGVNNYEFKVNETTGEEVPPATTLTILYDLRVDVIE